MSRPNYIDFVEHLYRYDLNLNDNQVLQAVEAVFHMIVRARTLTVWKSQLRKKGLKIPDGREKLKT